MAVLFLAMLSQNARASEEFIGNKALFGCYEDSLFSTELALFALERIDSLTLNTYAEKFDPFPAVDRKYSFEKIPCLKMLRLVWTRDGWNFMETNPFEAYLLNTCDSTFYPFGGNAAKFTLVLKDYLHNNFKPEIIMELLGLYINTLSIDYSYYIVNSYDDLEKAAGELLAKNYINFPEKKLREDIERFRNSIEPISIKNDSNSYAVSFCTWRQWKTFWNLEYWHFRVSQEEIRVIDRIKVPQKKY